MTNSLPLPNLAGRPCDDGARRIRLPDIGSAWRHALAYAAGSLQAHGLSPDMGDAQPTAHAGECRISPTLLARWRRFLRVGLGHDLPFCPAQAAITLLQRQVLAQLGIRPAQVTLLRHITQRPRMGATQPAHEGARPGVQRLLCWQTGVGQLASGLLMVDINTRLTDASGRTLAELSERLAVSGIDTAAIPFLPRDRAVMADYAQRCQRKPQIDCVDANVGDWLVGRDWGRRYARLAGEWAPAHWFARPSHRLADRLAQRLLGEHQGSLQPSALRHLVQRQLSDAGLRPERLEISHCRPAPLGRRLRIVQRDDAFEVIGDDGLLLAHGRC